MISAIISTAFGIAIASLVFRLLDRESARERRDRRYWKLAVFIVKHRMKREQRRQAKQSKTATS